MENKTTNPSNQNSPLVSSYTTAQTTSATTTASVGGRGASGVSAGEQKVVIGVFRSQREAEQAVNELRRQGFSNQEINIVSKKHSENETEFVEDDVTDGALTGGTLGGIGGLLLGAGALAIPGLGPIVAVGPIAAALSGAVAGGVAGGLIDWGIPEEVSRRYESSVKQGGILTVIRTSSATIDKAASILRQNGAQDVETHTSNKLQ